ncbi:MAG: diol dehydratase small subunit [Thermoleophilia bacterium]
MDDPRRHYPLSTRRPDEVRTPSGVPLAELTLASLREGRLDAGDVRATAATLRLQADVAAVAGQAPLAVNLRRGAELTAVPDEVVLAVYTALRPHRSTAAELDAWATRLADEFGAEASAALVREARDAYAARGLLRREPA